VQLFAQASEYATQDLIDLPQPSCMRKLLALRRVAGSTGERELTRQRNEKRGLGAFVEGR
jgi:hypothetical protein